MTIFDMKFAKLNYKKSKNDPFGTKKIKKKRHHKSFKMLYYLPNSSSEVQICRTSCF